MASTKPSLRSASSAADPGSASRLGLVRPHAGRLAVVAGLSLAGSALVLVQPLLTRSLIDDGLLARRMDVVATVAALLVAAAIAAAAMNAANRWHYTKLSAAVLFRLRESVYGHLQRLSPEYFARVRPGDLLARLDGDVAEVQRFAVDRLLAAVNGTLVLAGSVAVLVLLSPSLSLLAAALLPLQAILLRIVRPIVERRTRDVRGRSSDVTAFLVERLGAVKLVQSVGAEEREAGNLSRLNASYLRDLLGLELAGFAAGAGPALLLSVTTAVVFVVGGAQVVAGTLSLGTLIAFSTYLGRAAAPVQTLLGLTVASRRARVSLERVLEITREPPAVASPATPRALPADAAGAIRLEHVRFRYATRGAWTLDGADVAIAGGERIAIVGASGAGKSTLLDLLHRHYDPAEGRVLLDGVDLRELDLGELRRRVAVVAQDVTLLAGSLAENVRYAAPHAGDDAVARAVAAAGLDELVARLPAGLETEVGPRGTALSGGERQRVAIARAILQDPLVLVLDEATSAVDAATSARIAATVDRLFAGRTRIVVSHHAAALAGADRVLELADGRIVDRGAPEMRASS